MTIFRIKRVSDGRYFADDRTPDRFTDHRPKAAEYGSSADALTAMENEELDGCEIEGFVDCEE